MKKLVVVLSGGNSPEREISLKSGLAIEHALKEAGFATFSMDPAKQNFNKMFLKCLSKIDVVFLALHGKGGEDGSIQGYLDTLKVPYTGSGVLASALGMNKIYSKRLFILNGMPTPAFQVFESEHSVKLSIPLPVVVKPDSAGSTIGVAIVKEKKLLKSAMKKAKKFGDRILIEKYIKGKEITVAVLCDKALPVIEIIPKTKFYDYKAKYTPGMSYHRIPADLSAKQYEYAQKLALKVHNVLGCSGVSRVDMIARKNQIFVLELNSIPGFTGTSLVPEAASFAGISFPELVTMLVKDARRKKC